MAEPASAVAQPRVVQRSSPTVGWRRVGLHRAACLACAAGITYLIGILAGTFICFAKRRRFHHVPGLYVQLGLRQPSGEQRADPGEQRVTCQGIARITIIAVRVSWSS